MQDELNNKLLAATGLCLEDIQDVEPNIKELTEEFVTNFIAIYGDVQKEDPTGWWGVWVEQCLELL